MKKIRRLIPLLMILSMLFGFVTIISAQTNQQFYFQDNFDNYSVDTILAQSSSTQMNNTLIPDVTLAVGARGSGGDNTSGWEIIEKTTGDKYLSAKSGQFSSAARGASIDFTNLNIPAYTTLNGKNLVMDFDVQFVNGVGDATMAITGLERDLQINGTGPYANDHRTLGTVYNGIDSGEWYSAKVIINSMGNYYIMLTDTDGQLDYYYSGTTTATNLTTMTFYIPQNTVNFDNLKIYTANAYTNTVTFQVVDKDNTPVSDASITFGDATFSTDARGQVAVVLPEGSYNYTAQKSGYVNSNNQEAATGTVRVSGSNIIEDITLSKLNYTSEPTTVTVSGGQLVMSKPISSTTSTSKAFVVSEVFDQYDVPITDGTIGWSIAPETEGISISDGVVYVTRDLVMPTDRDRITINVVATVTKSGISKSEQMPLTISNYLFYEPGIDSSSYGDVTIGEMGNENVMILPADADATLTLPEAITLKPGTAQSISFKTAWGGPDNKVVYTYERSIDFQSSDNTSLVKLYYVNYNIGLDATVDSSIWTLGTTLGSMSTTKDIWSDVNILLKTDANGASKAIITMDGGEENEIHVTGTDLKYISLKQGMANGSRYIGFKDFVIAPADVRGIEIIGDDTIAKILGKDVKRTYNYSAMVVNEGETFIWSLADENGNQATYNGVTLHSSTGVLTITDVASAGTVYLKVTGSSSTDKTTIFPVEIKDYAYINAGTSVVDGSATVNIGDKFIYEIARLVDEYNDDVLDYFTPVWSVSDTRIATIDRVTGELTALAPGVVKIKATVGNAGKTTDIEYTTKIVEFYYSADVTSKSTVVDVSTLPQVGAYLVTVDEEEKEMEPSNGKIIIDTTGASKIEVSPLYKFNLNGTTDGYISIGADTTYTAETGYGLSGVTSTAANGLNLNNETFNVSLPDGLYDFTFIKAETERATIYVNGNIVGARVDMSGWSSGYADATYEPITTGATYTAKDVVISNGIAKISIPGEKSYSLNKVIIKKVADFADRKTHIWIAGDSTLASYYPVPTSDDWIGGLRRTGWAQVLDMFLTDDMIVDNFALAGDYAENWLVNTFPSVLGNAQPGDYLFIQFGINDRNYGSKSTTGMQTAINTMVEACYNKGIIPVVISPQRSTGYSWGDAGEWEAPNGTNADFFTAAQEYAIQKGTLFVDLSDITATWFGKVGKEYVAKNYYLWDIMANEPDDGLHLAYQGAKKIAEMVATNIAIQIDENAQDIKGNSFEGIQLNKLITYNFSYINSTGTEVVTQITAVAQDGMNSDNDDENNNISISDDFKITTPIITSEKVSIDVRNVSNQEKSITLVVASYGENGELINNSIVARMISADDRVTVDAGVPTSGNYKVMVWDSLSGMAPYIIAVE